MVHEGLRNVAAGAAPSGLKRGIDAPSPPCPTAAGDRPRVDSGGRDRPRGGPVRPGREIGELIAEAFDKVGKDGVITVEESRHHG
jgi:chaperonin GroEL